jgi:hypothetical protein
MEIPGGSDFIANSFDPYLLSRLRLNVGVQPVKWLKFYVEAQDTRALGYNGTPTAAMQDPHDIRAGYVELNTGEGQGFMIRAGRQEMPLGSQRFFSTSPWSNTSKSFDAIRAAYALPGVRVDLAAGSLVQTDGTRFDRHKPGEHFYTSYTSFSKLIPYSTLEPYFIAKTVLNVTGEKGPLGEAAMYTTGLHWFGTLPGRIDYSAEHMRQWGTWGADRVAATGGSYTLGWRVSTNGWKPRVSADYSTGSGDRNAKDGTRGGLDILYGSAQPYFSYTGLFCWKNIQDVRLGTELAPAKKTKLVVDYRDYYLSTAQDGLYNSTGTRIVLDRKATSIHVGHGPECQLVQTVGSYGQFTLGVAGLFAGDYLKQAGKPNGYVYPYLGWQKAF